MAAVLNIGRDRVLRTARLDTANTQNQTDGDAVIADEQEAIEATLNPGALADSSLTAVLVAGVAKLLAAELLERIGREEGRSGNFQGLGITVSQVPDHAARLRAEARAALAPYARRASPSGVPSEASPAGRAAQERLLGKAEMEK